MYFPKKIRLDNLLKNQLGKHFGYFAIILLILAAFNFKYVLILFEEN